MEGKPKMGHLHEIKVDEEVSRSQYERAKAAVRQAVNISEGIGRDFWPLFLYQVSNDYAHARATDRIGRKLTKQEMWVLSDRLVDVLDDVVNETVEDFMYTRQTPQQRRYGT